jgi:RNase adaptor protein for sRNA GlmZ degradation
MQALRAQSVLQLVYLIPVWLWRVYTSESMKAEFAGHARKVCETKDVSSGAPMVEIKIVSFGYKAGSAPPANMLFDVRFLDNPYWVEELRPLTGLDKPVQDYVLEQPLSKHFLSCVHSMIVQILPKMAKSGTQSLTIAFGCTGGQHRSVSLVEALARTLKETLPGRVIKLTHRELDRKSAKEVGSEPQAGCAQSSQ